MIYFYEISAENYRGSVFNTGLGFILPNNLFGRKMKVFSNKI